MTLEKLTLTIYGALFSASFGLVYTVYTSLGLLAAVLVAIPIIYFWFVAWSLSNTDSDFYHFYKSQLEKEKFSTLYRRLLDELILNPLLWWFNDRDEPKVEEGSWLDK